MSEYLESIKKRRAAASVSNGIAGLLASAQADPEKIGTADKPALPTAPTPESRLTSTKLIRQGVQFRLSDLDLIADMVHECRRGRVRLTGKLGPSTILRAALDELAKIYHTDKPRFLEIMGRYRTHE